MFVAETENGEMINLLENQYVKKGKYRCRICQGEMLFKKGSVLRSHFAHLSLKDCWAERENESEQHLQLKSQLYQWLKGKEIVYLEAPLPMIRQVADLLVNHHIALEIQCSRLSLTRLKERTRCYRRAGYSVIWLLGKELWLGKRLTELQRHLLYFSSYAGFYLWELDYSQKVLRLRYMIHEDIRGRVQCLTRDFAFGKENLVEILRFPYQRQVLSSFEGVLDQYLNSYIAKQLYYRDARWMKKQEEAYMNGRNLLTQPLEFFYPQLCWPSIENGFLQVERDLTVYYEAFFSYYQQQNNKKEQVLYAPAFYRQALKKRIK